MIYRLVHLSSISSFKSIVKAKRVGIITVIIGESMRLIVASKNPVKISATETGFAKMFPEVLFEVMGIEAPSDVSDQPMTEGETIRGATNRAENASRKVPDADYWIGIEGGLKEENGQLLNITWVVIKSKDGRLGEGNTGSFVLPKKIAELVREGKELAHADDEVFARQDSGRKNGTIGILTGDALTRSAYYESAVILALIPFKNPSLY